MGDPYSLTMVKVITRRQMVAVLIAHHGDFGRRDETPAAGLFQANSLITRRFSISPSSSRQFTNTAFDNPHIDEEQASKDWTLPRSALISPNSAHPLPASGMAAVLGPRNEGLIPEPDHLIRPLPTPPTHSRAVDVAGHI